MDLVLCAAGGFAGVEIDGFSCNLGKWCLTFQNGT